MPGGMRTARRTVARDNRAVALLLLSAVAFSTAGLFARWSSVGLPALIVWRSLFGGVALLPVVLIGGSGRLGRELASLGRLGWAIILASSIGTLCFLAALRLTTVADVSIVYAAAPLLTALIAWGCLGETPRPRTLSATALATSGTVVTVAGTAAGATLHSDGFLGDGLAVLMTLSIAAMTILARRHPGPPALLVAGLSSLLTGLLVLPFAWSLPGTLAVGWAEAARLASFGAITMGVALPCYLLGAARVPAARAMLISALEMPLGPLWVCLAFGEFPSAAALAGGALTAAAILWDLTGE